MHAKREQGRSLRPDNVECRYIPGLPGYCVSRGGRVFSCRRRTGKWYPVKVKQSGKSLDWTARIVRQSQGSKRIRQVAVAELIALAWLGEKPVGHCAAFLDRNRSNLDVDNIVWMPIRKAMGWYVLSGSDHPNAIITESDVVTIRREVHAAGATVDFAKVAAKWHMTPDNVKAIARGTTWRHVDAGVPLWVPPPKSRPEHRKLSDDEVRAIKRRFLHGETVSQVWTSYRDRVTSSAIRRIRAGKSFANITI